MTNSFELLAAFLDRFGDEVEGRELAEPPEDIQIQLRALALGRLPGAERDSLFSLLRRNPEWIAQLADEVKALRSQPGQTSQEQA